MPTYGNESRRWLFVGAREQSSKYVGVESEALSMGSDAFCHMGLEVARSHLAWVVVGPDEDDRAVRRGLDRLRSISKSRLRTAVIGHSGDIERFQEWLRSGADVYLSEETVPGRLAAVTSVAEELGIVLVDRPFLDALAAMRGQFQLIEPLTPRETDILGLLCQGMSNAEIARCVAISIHTVEFHLRNIYSKLGVVSRLEAVTLAKNFLV